MKTKRDLDTRKIIGWVTITIFFIAMMFVFGELDRHISTSIYNGTVAKHNWDPKKFDDTFSAIGATLLVLPIFFCISGLIQSLLIIKRLRAKRGLFWGLNALLILICLFVNFFSMETHPHSVNWTEWIVQIVMGVFYLAVMVSWLVYFWMNKRADENHIKNTMWLSIRAILFLVTIFVVVNVMKPIFGRPRPYQVLEKGFGYRYPMAISDLHPRGASFPSGHVIAAMSIFAITLMFYRKPSWKHYSINTFFGALVILVAFSRIFSLNHWTADTFMSMGIGALAYSLYLKLFNNRLIK